MIASFGNVESPALLNDFLEMAQGNLELNETNRKKSSLQHDSGWGAVYKVGDTYQRIRNAIPCWQDPEINNLKKMQVCILHARKASVSNIRIENTHPFQTSFKGGDWFFCHNGTIRDKFPSYPQMEGDTDSENFFYYLLENLNEKQDIESITTAVNNLKNYTALNSFLFNGRILYAICLYQEDPLYYALKILQEPDKVIISSEILPSFPGNWTEISNGSIIKLDTATLKANTYSLLS